MRMKRTKRLIFLVVAIATINVASAISTKSKDVEDEKLNSPSPSPSPSTSSEFASRAGITSSKKEKPSGKPLSNFVERNKNSSEAAASTKSQISFPGGPDDKNIEDKENGPEGVELHLLEEKEKEFDGEGRSKFPRIYYGEAHPPPPPYSGSEEHPDFHNKQHTEYDQNGEGKYFNQKNYGKSKGKKQKKRFEYKYDPTEQHGPQTPEEGHFGHGPDFHPEGDRIEIDGKSHNNHEHERDFENDHHHDGHGYGYGDHHHAGHHGHYGHGHHGFGPELISKALSVLIPSALLLTGVSALFPTRIHVPTNDYRPIDNKNNVHRYKRSIDGFSDPNGHFLEPAEHRGADNAYDFEVGRYRDFTPVPVQEYSESQVQNMNGFMNSDELRQQSKDAGGFGKKLVNELSSYIQNQNQNQNEPSTPQEYDRFHFGPQTSFDFIVPDSAYQPASPIPTQVAHVLAPTSQLPEVTSEASSQKPRRRLRQRINIKVRQGKRQRSRPLPTASQPLQQNSIHNGDFNHVNDIQTHFEPEKQITNNHIQQTAQNQLPQQNQNQNQNTLQESKQLELILSAIQESRRQMDSEIRSLAQGANIRSTEAPKQVDLSPDGPVMGLISSYAEHDRDSPACQKKALCELAIKGKSPSATKFETFLWSLASLVPEQFSKIYDLDEIFKAIKTGGCDQFHCIHPNLDLQV